MHGLRRVAAVMPQVRVMVARVVPQRNFFWRHRWYPFDEVRLAVREMERYMDKMDRSIWSPRYQSIPVCSPTTGFRVSLDVGSFKPEDVKVSLDNRVVTIRANAERDGVDGVKSYQEMTHKYTLPEEADLANLKSYLSPDGTLTIEAPVPGKEQQPKEIPISKGTLPEKHDA